MPSLFLIKKENMAKEFILNAAGRMVEKSIWKEGIARDAAKTEKKKEAVGEVKKKLKK